MQKSFSANGLASKFSKRLLLCILLLLLIFCGAMLQPRFIYQEGIKQLGLKNYEKSIQFLTRAEHKMPAFIPVRLVQADWFRIYTYHGQALYHSAMNMVKNKTSLSKTFPMLKEAQKYLIKADTILPLSYRNTYWLSQTTDKLERIFAWKYPGKKNPYNTEVIYQKAMALRPSGVSIRYEYLRYLAYKKQYKKIPLILENLISIYPRAFQKLQKEAFFNDSFIPHVIKGLQTASGNQIFRNQTLHMLSRLFLEKGDTKKAIAYYETWLKENPFNNYATYAYLGNLYLIDHNLEQSFLYFKKALLKSGNPEKFVEKIYRYFVKSAQKQAFQQFLSYLKAEETEIKGLGMAEAMFLIQIGELNQAEIKLNQMLRKKEAPEVYYLLAKIAARQNDFDKMEIQSQRAAYLDDTDPKYLYLFARALSQQKKYVQAEKVITNLINFTGRKSSIYFHFRADVKWNQKKYESALKDWETAFSISPKNGSYPYQIALAYEKLKQFEKAELYAKKAFALSPENKAFQKLQTRLKSNAQ